mmetsp:Transcript_14954/g.28144  ORF Transcript_14954/g.28144 Transcript_14954/m.28144 type:complete len:86 (+) Transcript_14954:1400-1657(+)
MWISRCRVKSAEQWFSTLLYIRNIRSQRIERDMIDVVICLSFAACFAVAELLHGSIPISNLKHHDMSTVVMKGSGTYSIERETET